jgi:sulfur relay (sulfurtransferase) complex TusBCD TusD component (DsrE family)
MGRNHLGPGADLPYDQQGSGPITHLAGPPGWGGGGPLVKEDAVMKNKLSALVVALLLVTGVGVAGVAAATGSATSSAPAEGAGLVVNVTTDDTWSANMAFSLATNAVGQGLDVIVFLNVRGVYLADAERTPATEGNSDQDLHQKLQAFVDAGGTVVVCPSCAMEAGLTQDDLIDGAVIGEPGGIIPILADPAYNVISYMDPTED